MSNKKNYVIAVDFDGTLCEYKFPEIGEQKQHHKHLLQSLIELRDKGHKLILWTCRGDNLEYPCLSQAIEWCKNQGLEFDAINENIPGTKKLSGPSPKVVADFYIDDKALGFDQKNFLSTLDSLTSL